MKILCVIPTLRDDPSETVESLRRQVLPPTRIIVASGSKELSDEIMAWKDSFVEAIYVRPDFKKSVGERIASALDSALQSVALDEFDCFLRIDADIILPPEFTTKNLPIERTIFHGDGSTLFFSIKSFMEVFGGRFPIVNEEDAYALFKYEESGYIIRDWAPKPIVLRTSSRHNSWRYFYHGGYWHYRLGYEFVHHSFGALRHLLIDKNMLELFEIIGFLSGWFRNVEKLDIADFVWRKRAPFSSKKLSRLLKSREG
ncbi:MAG: hypothetical protein ACRECH_13705 [Nitrososphaerales archaeon]